jgi:hypothetical protein
MSDASRQWIVPIGLLCLTLPIFGITNFAHAAELFVLFLVFVMICVWVDGRTQ